MMEPVTRSVMLPVLREEAWGALTTLDLLAAWLGEVVELEPKAGGAVVVREADGSTRRGLVERIEPGRPLVLRWRRISGAGASIEVGEATRVTLELEDEDGQVRLTVTEEPVALVAAAVAR
jgi:uncharacterized protein YndB with AHSA1/START domain